jgi:sugar lactone lactonase YvrE
MKHPIRLWRPALIGSVATVTVLSLTGVGLAGASGGHGPAGVHGAGAREQAWQNIAKKQGGQPTADHSGDDDADLADEQAQYDFERTAPAGFVSGQALVAAAQQAASLPQTGGSWQEFTNAPYNAQPSNYTDPFWGNEGAGFSLVGGRVTALTTAPDGTWFAGTADGGVWRSSDQGQHWTPVFDNEPTLSIGALAVDPIDGSVWVGTGEANTSQDSYAGTGVYRSTNDGNTWQRVGDDSSGNNPLVSHTVFRVAFDSAGDAYAATNNGLFRLAAGASSWTEVLDPAGPVDNPPYDQQVTDVAIVPGSGGSDVIAAIGWHGPGNTQYNGFYQSTNSGMSFSQVTPTGQINASDIGRTTFAYSADGSKLYAIVQSPAAQGAGASSVLQGIFSASSVNGAVASVAGPWTLIANAKTLRNSGSASPTFGNPGVQAWYNQDLAVDPNNPNHIYAGLEEVYESNNGGSSWITASPYWNYNFACDAANPPTCPNVTHPDQHAMMIADGQIVIGNDGGVYSRPLSDIAEDGNWTDLNATLHDLQFYDARAGKNGNTTSVWGGMQDNGSGYLTGGNSQMVEPAGGDGFDVIINPQNANDIAGEYVDGTMYTSTDGGHSFSDFISPTCVGQAETGLTPRSNCDPNARFVTPIAPDQQNKNVWLLGGEDVWVSADGWQTACTDTACSWKPVFDTGAGNAVTALSSVGGGSTIYAAWVGGGGNPGPAFATGIATNYGGTWHQLNMAGLPNRYISGMTVDPNNPAHAYAVFGGFSRRWVPGGGVGHVFETTNGGQSWTDISGNLPDIPGDALVMSHGHLALGTDQGVFTAAEGQGTATSWSRLGTGLPNSVVDDLTAGPDGYIYAATHGRGVWRISF